MKKDINEILSAIAELQIPEEPGDIHAKKYNEAIRKVLEILAN